MVPQLPDVKEVYSAELRVSREGGPAWNERDMCLPKWLGSLFLSLSQGQLKPELPEDVALFFYISSDSLVLSVLIAATTQKGNTVSPFCVCVSVCVCVCVCK